MKNIKLLILLTIICFTLAYSEQRYIITSLKDTSDNINKLNENFKYIDINKQDKALQVFTSAPTSSDLGSGQMGIYSDYLYININNDMWYVRLSST